MKQPRVSVIVPVYKAEKFIVRCIESLLAQTLVDFELLLIDDGSPDHSGVICDEYAKKDSRIRVFHKENGGVGSARQMGIDYARGEYSIHADSDDWIEPMMLEDLYAKVKETRADMVITDFFVESRFGRQYVSTNPSTESNITMLRQLISGDLHGSTCNKMVRTSLYKEYDIHIPPNMKYVEDTFLICSLLMHNIKVVYLPNAYYHYDMIRNNHSITSHGQQIISKQNLDCLIFFTDHFERILPEALFKDLFKERKIFIKQLMWYSGHYNRKEFIKKYKEVNKQIMEEYNQGMHQGARQFVYAVNGHYYLMKIIKWIREIIDSKKLDSKCGM